MPMMFSSVGGGPLERVTQALSCMGTPAEMHAMWSPETWRKRFKSGKTMRILTRLEALALYPAKAVWDGFVASAITNVGDPLTAPVLVVTTNPFLLPCVAALTKPLLRRPRQWAQQGLARGKLREQKIPENYSRDPDAIYWP